MGTRSITKFENDEGEAIAVLYRQYDGYPSGHGADLFDILNDRPVVNGYSDAKTQINGAASIPILVIRALAPEDETGNFYLYPAGTSDMGEEYTYTLSVVENRVWLKIEGYETYDGYLDDFKPEDIEDDE